MKIEIVRDVVRPNRGNFVRVHWNLVIAGVAIKTETTSYGWGDWQLLARDPVKEPTPPASLLALQDALQKAIEEDTNQVTPAAHPLFRVVSTDDWNPNAHRLCGGFPTRELAEAHIASWPSFIQNYLKITEVETLDIRSVKPPVDMAYSVSEDLKAYWEKFDARK